MYIMNIAMGSFIRVRCRALLKPYISANASETDQVKSLFAIQLGEMYPVG